MRQFCVINEMLNLYCWDPRSGLFENIPDKYSTNIEFVDTGVKQTCVITVNKKLKCWRYNFKPFIPREYRTNVKLVVTAGVFTCAITNSGELGCWNLLDKNKE